MATQVSICNQALSAIGTRSQIASLTENSAEAAACSLHYSEAVLDTLRACNWNFARKQSFIALLKDSTAGQAVPMPWVYEYAYPNDCVRARYILPQFQSVAPQPNSMCAEYVGAPVKFLVSSDSDATGNGITVILTNQMQAMLVYTAQISNPALFDSDFETTVVYMLAARLAIPLTGDKGVYGAMRQEAQQKLLEAQATNGNEGLTVLEHTPDWMRVRGYASDWAYPDGGMVSGGPGAFGLLS